MFKELANGIVLKNKPYSIALFSSKVIKIIEKYLQLDDNQEEAGGLLMGYRRGNNFEITNITFLFSGDKRNRNSFIRNDKKHIQIWKKLNRTSNGNISFLGEWYTHPEDNPTPSVIDLSEWKITREHNT